MKRAILFVLFAVLSCSVLAADAIVLDAGSSISSPDGSFFVLENAAFLLSREDMEAAVLALETVEIQKAALARYEAQEKWRVPVLLLVGVGGAAVGIVSTLLVKGILAR